MNAHTFITRGRALRATVATLFAAALLAVPVTPASAHATVQLYGETAKPNAYGAVFIRIPHAAAGLSTNVVDVAIPEGVTAVKPQRVAGWTEKVNLAADGKTVTSVSWSGGDLPDTSFQDFGISVKFPNTPGAKLYFKTVQTLSDGSQVAWVEIPAPGVDGHTLAKPAPSVTLAAAAAPADGSTNPAPNSANSSHGSAPMPTANGELILKADGNKIKVVADTSTRNAGRTAVLRLVEGENKKTTTILTTKLDARGDLVRTLNLVKTGSNGYRIDSGDLLEVVVDQKVIASEKA